MTHALSPLTLQQLMDHNPPHQSQARLKAPLSAMLASSTAAKTLASIPFQALCLDSRQVAAHEGFVLLKSQTLHCQKSRDYLIQAAQKAAFVLSEVDPIALFNSQPAQLDNQQSASEQCLALPCPVVYVPNIREFLGDLVQACLQYQQAVPLPTVVAVTGTNGKTTISQLVAQLTQLAGMSSAVMGTAGNGKLGALTQARHTTGDALAVQQFLYQMGRESADILALEASSHGLDQDRLQGVPVQVAIYTNLSRDHLDYHADMEEYAAAKAKLFDKSYFPDLTHAIINVDDDHAQVMLDRAHASGLSVWRYSLAADSDTTFRAAQIAPSLEGVEIALKSEHGDIEIKSPLLGRFNVANLLAAIAAVVALGVPLARIAQLVAQLHGAVGRMQRVPSKNGCFIVDYAHTPDALAQVLSSLKTHCTGTLWAIFGCGGDRDAGKRPIMAQAGLAGADKVILTADNPRSEDPKQILADMQVGMSEEQYKRTHIEPARQRAIEYAVTHAGVDDIVVIAGKGHETYQEINGVRHDFDDSIVLQQALAQAGRA